MNKNISFLKNEAVGPLSRPLLHSIVEARRLMGGISNSFFYELVSSGKIRTVKVGNRRLVPDEVIQLVSKEGV